MTRSIKIRRMTAFALGSALLMGCGGGGSGDGNAAAPAISPDAAGRSASLASRDAVARAAVALQILPGSFVLDGAALDMDGPECRTGSASTTLIPPNQVRIVFDACRFPNTDGTELALDGTVFGTCNSFDFNGDCNNAAIDFGDEDVPILASLFADASTDSPVASLGLLGPARIENQGDAVSITSDVDGIGTLFAADPQVVIGLLTENLRVVSNTNGSVITFTIDGRFGLSTEPRRGDCLEGSVNVATLTPISFVANDPSSGFNGGDIRFNVDGQEATVTYNVDGSLNVTDSTGNSQLVSALEADQFCTDDSVL